MKRFSTRTILSRDDAGYIWHIAPAVEDWRAHVPVEVSYGPLTPEEVAAHALAVETDGERGRYAGHLLPRAVCSQRVADHFRRDVDCDRWCQGCLGAVKAYRKTGKIDMTQAPPRLP